MAYISMNACRIIPFLFSCGSNSTVKDGRFFTGNKEKYGIYE